MNLLATKFHTRKELQDYLHEHPDADRSEHSVMSPAEKHRDYEENKKDAAIAQRVAEDFMGAPKKAPAPKSYPATAHLIEQLKKVGLERASATINSPISMAEEMAKLVWGRVHLTVPKDYQGPGGTVIQGVENLPVQMSRHPSSGNFEGNKPGHATFDFVVLTRDKKGKEVQLPLEGVHLFMQWLPVYRSEGVGGGGLGHRYIDRLFATEVGSHATKLEGKLQHLQTWYTQTYGHEPELVKAASALTERVAERYLRRLIADEDPVALTLPREIHLPPHVRPTPAHVPEGTDLAIWTWEETRNTPLKGPVTVYMGIAFAGKANKPLWYHSFRTAESRQKMIDETVASRKLSIQRKQEEMQKKKDFVHGIKVGDIFSSSWGYDQTNVDFFQCVDVKGKMVVVREIASKLSHSDRGADYVVAVPNHFTGEAKLVRPTMSGGFKVGDHYASPWDGKPEYQTPFGMGH